MTKAEATRELKALEEHSKKVTSSKEAAKKFLVDAGILEKNGKRLMPNYR